MRKYLVPVFIGVLMIYLLDLWWKLFVQVRFWEVGDIIQTSFGIFFPIMVFIGGGWLIKLCIK